MIVLIQIITFVLLISIRHKTVFLECIFDHTLNLTFYPEELKKEIPNAS